MEILPKEIESIKTIGNLYDNDVKLIKTFGGFHLAIGKKKKTSRKAEVLTGGSHPAIVAHQLSKEYGADFNPAIFKSEREALEDVENKSEYLPHSDLQKGMELYTLSKGNKIEFVLYKHGLTLGKYDAEIENKSLVLKNQYFKRDMLKAEKETANAISKAMKDKVYELNLKGIKKAR